MFSANFCSPYIE